MRPLGFFGLSRAPKSSKVFFCDFSESYLFFLGVIYDSLMASLGSFRSLKVFNASQGFEVS